MYPNRKPDRPTSPVREAAKQAEHERDRMTTLTPTEARQGSPRQMNLRVLIVSMVVLGAVGLALTAAYWGTAVEDHSIPAGPAQNQDARKAMDGSSPAPEATPNTKTPGSQ